MVSTFLSYILFFFLGIHHKQSFTPAMFTFFARYFKQTWTGAQCCSKDMWFVIHRLMMVLTWLLTLAGFFLIFFELGWEWIGNRKESTGNPHHILGCVTTGLCFIQPFMALLRPDPDSRK